jgi:Leucine-rich repeat (LRR) protein
MGGELSKLLERVSKNDPSLKELRLNGKLEDELLDAKGIAKLSKAIAHCTALETLWLKGQSLIQCQPLADALATNTSITHLFLEHCSFNGKQLAAALKHNRTLHQLTCDVDDADLAPLLDALQQHPSVRKLNFSGCPLTREPRTTEALTNLVRHMPSLTHLLLNSCGLTDRQLWLLLAEVRRHPKLTVLSLNNNLRTETDLLAVADMLANNRRLEQLSLGGWTNPRIWRKAVPQFLRACAQNVSLTQFGNVKNVMDPVAYEQLQGFLLRNEFKLPPAIPGDDELSNLLPFSADLDATQRRALAAARFLQDKWKHPIAADVPRMPPPPSKRENLERLRSDWERTVATFADSASAPAASLQRLTLVDKKLRFADFTRFPQLTALDVDSNAFSDDALLSFLPLRQLQKLSLRNCQLSSIAQTGIDTLPLLHTLDLRDNNFPLLDTLLASIRGCNALTTLFAFQSTASKSATVTPASFAPTVFADLRGLQTCDGVRNTTCVRDDPLAVKALNMLWKLGRVGPNNLKRVNLTNKQLPLILLHSVLSALYYLDVRELDARGNAWCIAPQYEETALLLMGPRFVWLDGEELTDFKRMQAYRLDKNEGVSENTYQASFGHAGGGAKVDGEDNNADATGTGMMPSSSSINKGKGLRLLTVYAEAARPGRRSAAASAQFAHLRGHRTHLVRSARFETRDVLRDGACACGIDSLRG